MKKNKTKSDYEKHLNDLYADSFGMEQAIEQFIYLTSDKRGERTTKSNIISCYVNHQLGTLLRRYDPIAFNVGFNEWNGR